MTNDLPIFAAIICSILIIVGSLVTLLGSIGLLFFSNFYTRIHTPLLGSTIGAICFLSASAIFFFYTLEKLPFSTFIILALLFISSPVTTMLLMRVAIYRASKEN